jgi:hypothetical protein
MKLHTLAAAPKLIEFVIDDADIITKYGEAITFHSWDRQPLDIFMKLASATESNVTNIIGIVKDLILDDAGKPILTADTMLPTDLLMRAISKITSELGK